MPKKADRRLPWGLAAWLLRQLAAVGIGLFGTVGVVLLSLGMNGQVERRVIEPVTVVETLVVAPRPRVTEQRPERTTPSRRARAVAPSASPLLAAGLSGLDFGLGSAADQALLQATRALVDQIGGAIRDESTVEQPPSAQRRTPPSFPASARAKGQTGQVTLSFVVDVDGSVQDVVVVAAAPPGVFDQAAIEAVRQWQFEPGSDQGSPVAVRVRQTLAFELE